MTASIIYGMGIILGFIGIRIIVKKIYNDYRKCKSEN